MVLQLALGATLGIWAAVPLFQLLPRRDIEWHVPNIFTVLPVVAGLMLAAGLLATVGPARRGLRIQPIQALREVD